MHTLLSFFGVLARLLRPTRGAHTTAFGYLRELGFEARRNRSRRVRRYVEPLTPTEYAEPAPLAAAPSTPTPTPTPPPSPPAVPTPQVPAPRKPLDDDLVDAYPKVEFVRAPYLAWENRQADIGELVA